MKCMKILKEKKTDRYEFSVIEDPFGFLELVYIYNERKDQPDRFVINKEDIKALKKALKRL